MPNPPTNSGRLDDGTCGHDLQLGAASTASSSNKPWFILIGDGGSSAYSIAIDGTNIGTFNGGLYGHVCIGDTLALRDGTHTLTGHELKPNSQYDVAPFTFTVDTVAPPALAKPALEASTDSARTGDNTTAMTSVRLAGTETSGLPFRCSIAASWSVAERRTQPGTGR